MTITPAGDHVENSRLTVALPLDVADIMRYAASQMSVSMTHVVARAIDLAVVVDAAESEGKTLGVLSGSGPDADLRPVTMRSPALHSSERPVLLSVNVSGRHRRALESLATKRASSCEDVVLDAVVLLGTAQDALLMGERMVVTFGTEQERAFQVVQFGWSLPDGADSRTAAGRRA